MRANGGQAGMGFVAFFDGEAGRTGADGQCYVFRRTLLKRSCRLLVLRPLLRRDAFDLPDGSYPVQLGGQHAGDAVGFQKVLMGDDGDDSCCSVFLVKKS